AHADAARAVRAARRLRPRLPPARGGPGPVPPRPRGRGHGGGGQRRDRGPPARRLVARPPVLRGMAQASWPVALFPPLRGLAPWAAGPRRGVVRGLDALAFTPAGHTARGPAEQRHVIRSLLDTDRYKFTMMQAVLHRYPAAQASYRFRCRSKGVDLARHIDAISDAIDALCALRLAPDELDYLRGLRFIAPDFVDFLDRKSTRLNSSHVKISYAVFCLKKKTQAQSSR